MRAYPLDAAGTPRVEDEARRRREWLARAQKLTVKKEEQTANEQTGDGIIGGFYTYEEAIEIIDLFGRIINKSNIEIRIPSDVKLHVRKRPSVLGALAPWLSVSRG